jgi:hypothetical protein
MKIAWSPSLFFENLKIAFVSFKKYRTQIIGIDDFGLDCMENLDSKFIIF